MFHNRKMLSTIFLIFILLFLFSGNASAKTLFNDTIDQGDGYQINNIVIDVTEVFTGQDAATFRIYEGDDEDYIHDPFLSTGGSFEFDIEDEEAEITLINVYSGVVPRVKLLITISDDDFINSNTEGVVDGGHSEAEYSLTPDLEITKSVDKNNIDLGDTVRVTVTVENIGDGDAYDVVFSDPQQPKFILIDDILGSPSRMNVNIDDSAKKIYVYDLKATEAGTFALNPTTAIFSNSVGESFPEASSNSPTVIVNPGEDLVNADLEFTTTLDKYTVNRNDEIQGTITIKNNGDAPATAVTVDINVPDGLEFQDGSDIEVISNVPTIYLESFGVQQEKEFTFTVKAAEVGTYTLSMENSYLFDNGVDAQLEEVTSESVTNKIYVVKGEYDYLFEQPIYVYVIPLVIIGVIVGWLYHRHKQYKF
jgi:uncharacterized repeat protein (TIGR01451 family)